MASKNTLADHARIFVQGGAGGNGCMSFRREAHVPRGGPDGGDGGRGGSVILLCDDSLRDLATFKRRAHFKASRGRHGEGGQRHGASGEDLIVRLPPGTQVIGLDQAHYDFVQSGQQVVIAHSGSGGRGNKRFANAVRQAPRFAELGLPGEEGWIELKLKLLADVGLVGLPNAGKSSLLKRMTRAMPKIADYPFTTLEPVLGVIDSEERQLVVADIPGLIEGASEGVGLGHQFLAHIERTQLLVHVLDLNPFDQSDPLSNYETIERELKQYDQRLAELPRVLVLSKSDLLSQEQTATQVAFWEKHLDGDIPVIAVSSASGSGLEQLKQLLLQHVPQRRYQSDELLTQPTSTLQPLAEYRLYQPGQDHQLRVEKVDQQRWQIKGGGVERLIARHDLENEDALIYIEERLRKLGILDQLQAAGFTDGDDVEIAGVTFDFQP